MMPPRGGNFQCPFGAFLTFDIAKVAAHRAWQNLTSLGGGDWGLTGIMAHHFIQRSCRKDLGCTHPRGFGTTGLGAQQDAILFCGSHCRRQRPDHRNQATIQR